MAEHGRPCDRAKGVRSWPALITAFARSRDRPMLCPHPISRSATGAFNPYYEWAMGDLAMGDGRAWATVRSGEGCPELAGTHHSLCQIARSPDALPSSDQPICDGSIQSVL